MWKLVCQILKTKGRKYESVCMCVCMHKCVSMCVCKTAWNCMERESHGWTSENMVSCWQPQTKFIAKDDISFDPPASLIHVLGLHPCSDPPGYVGRTSRILGKHSIDWTIYIVTTIFWETFKKRTPKFEVCRKMKRRIVMH